MFLCFCRQNIGSAMVHWLKTSVANAGLKDNKNNKNMLFGRYGITYWRKSWTPSLSKSTQGGPRNLGSRKWWAISPGIIRCALCWSIQGLFLIRECLIDLTCVGYLPPCPGKAGEATLIEIHNKWAYPGGEYQKVVGGAVTRREVCMLSEHI